MKAAFGYCRVSSAGQAGKDRDGVPRQQAAIRKFAAANGLHIARWFVDSITGKTDLEHRPALQELIAAANGIRTIVIEKVDRLARDLMVQESIIADLKRNNFEVLSTFEADLCSTDPTRILVRQILGAFSQYEKSMIVQKLWGARQRARVKNPNYREGRAPYGTNKEELENIARILELRGDGLTLTAIASKLREEQRPARDGGIWHPRQVLRIIDRANS
jgi:DNA invertase Pin-like site-specific DNA recombinase